MKSALFLLFALIISRAALAATPTFTNTGTQTRTATQTPTSTITATFSASPTRTITPTSTATPVLVSYVSSTSSAWANSPVITIPYAPSASGLSELLCVVIGTNNTDDSSVVSSVSFGGVSMTAVLQVPSLRYSEGIELWALAIGTFPYSMSGNIVITQPSYNSIINDNVEILEFRGAAQGTQFAYGLTYSPQAANQSVTLSASVVTAFQTSLVLAGYSGVKAIKTFPTNYTNRQYNHKYGMFASVDTIQAAGAGSYTGRYVSYPPNNPAASILVAEIPSRAYFTPSPTFTVSPTPTVTPTATPTPIPTP